MKSKSPLLSTLILTGFLLTACSSTGTSKDESSSSSSTVKVTESSSSSKKEYAIGDKITFDGEAEITIKSVNYTDERNVLVDAKTDKIAVVTYDVTNLSDKDYVVGSEIDLYINGKKMDTYPISSTFDTLSAGRTLENATVAFEIAESGKGELEVSPSLSFTAKPAIVSFTLE